MSNQGQRQHGFTLVELLIVLAILGTLTALAAPAVGAAVQQAAIVKARSDLRTIDTTLALTPGGLPSPLPSPPARLPGAGGDYRVDGGGRAYLPVTVSGQTVFFYSNSPWPR